MSAEPIGTHTRGKPLPVETILRLKRLSKSLESFREVCRQAGVTRMTAKKYLRPQSALPDFDI